MEQLKDTTKICKICFEPIKFDSFHTLLNDSYVCYRCLKQMNPIFKNFKIDDVKALAIYHYNDYLRKLIFQYKGCLDYELKDIFITPYLKELKILYKNYYMLIIPSSKEKIIERGFNHCLEMFKPLNLKIIEPIEKIKDEKQSDKSYLERQKVKENLKLVNKEIIKNKKILVVDDICTTGATLKAVVSLLKEAKPKKIKILVVAKRDFTKKELELLNDPSFVLN